MKKCLMCGEIKSLNEFHNHKLGKFGKNPHCIKCRSEIAHQRYIENKDIILRKSKEYYYQNQKKCNDRHLQYYVKNKENLLDVSRKYYYDNIDKVRETHKIYTIKNYNKKRAYERERLKLKRKNDYSYRLHSNISRMLRYSLRHGKNRQTWEKLLGYTVNDLIMHLEKLFTPGMNWNNYGQWHIDHKIPISYFKTNNANDKEIIMKCWCLNNLQPMWAAENIKKGNKILNNESYDNRDTGQNSYPYPSEILRPVDGRAEASPKSGYR